MSLNERSIETLKLHENQKHSIEAYMEDAYNKAFKVNVGRIEMQIIHTYNKLATPLNPSYRGYVLYMKSKNKMYNKMYESRDLSLKNSSIELLYGDKVSKEIHKHALSSEQSVILTIEQLLAIDPSMEKMWIVQSEGIGSAVRYHGNFDFAVKRVAFAFGNRNGDLQIQALFLFDEVAANYYNDPDIYMPHLKDAKNKIMNLFF